MNLSRFFSRAAAGIAAALLLASCGGGSSDSDPSVTTMTASVPVRYGQTMTIAIVGRNLGNIEVTVDGRCDNLTRLTGGTDDSVQYSCTPRTIGEIVPRVRRGDGNRELASVRATVPLPRVSATISNGARTETFVMELDPIAAPAAVDNFLAYVGSGSTGFFRNTVVSHADPTMGVLFGGFTVGAGGVLVAKPPTRSAIALEASAERKHLRGTVGMYRRGDANSATTEWFVNTRDNAFLDVGSAENPLGFTVFGTVVSNLEALDLAAGVPVKSDLGTGMPRVPDTPITITAISQTR